MAIGKIQKLYNLHRGLFTESNFFQNKSLYLPDNARL